MLLYQVSITRAAEKEISQLPKTYYLPVRSAILKLADHPRPAGSKKLRGFENTYRVRVGPYRIIYVVADTLRIVTVTRVAHRSNVYD